MRGRIRLAATEKHIAAFCSLDFADCKPIKPLRHVPFYDTTKPSGSAKISGPCTGKIMILKHSSSPVVWRIL